MISLLAYSNNAGELHSVKEQVCDLAAYLSEEKWETSCFSSLEQLMAFLKSQPLVNLACYDVTERESRDYLSTVRKKYRDTLLMLIADSTLSPMEYVKPDILAASLILRPYSQEDLRGKLKDLICEYLSRMQDGEDAFIVETREGKTRIPYEQIYYLEARDKKIYVRLRDRELSFYDTIEELEEKLPKEFARCHRSFIVNRRYIEKIMLSQSEIGLTHGISVPLSRSYKPYFKAIR